MALYPRENFCNGTFDLFLVPQAQQMERYIRYIGFMTNEITNLEYYYGANAVIST